MTARSATASSPNVTLDLSARVGNLPRIRSAIEKWSDRHGVPSGPAYRIQLAVEEACSNIIRHAFARGGSRRRLHVELAWRGDHICVVIRDTGRAFNIAKYPGVSAARIALRTRARGGYGIHLIKSLVDKYSYMRSAEGENQLRLIKYC